MMINMLSQIKRRTGFILNALGAVLFPALALAQSDPRYLKPIIEQTLQTPALQEQQLREYAPYQAVRADLFRRAGDLTAARDAYDRAIALVSTTAERDWLVKQKSRLDQGEGR